MTLRSIIDVEVNAEKFKAFKAEFDKYQALLASQKGHWDKAGKAMGGVNKQFESLASLSEELIGNIDQAAGGQDKFRKNAEKSEQSMRRLAGTTKDVAKGILGATTALLKWSGIATAIGGLLGAGGLFGIDRLAASTAGKGRAASGLGTTVGKNQAFNLDFGRFVDTQSLLGAVAGAKSSYEGRADLTKLGVTDYNKKDPADLAVEVMGKLRGLYQKTPENQRTSEYFNAFGAGRFMDMQDMRRLGGGAGFDSQVGKYRSDSKYLNMGPGMTGAYQNMQDQFSRSGAHIEKTFSEALVGLAPNLERLSKAVDHAISSFMKSDAIKDAIDGLGHGIKSLSEYLNSPDFAVDMSDFMDGLQSMASALKKTFSFFSGSSSPEEQMKKFGRLESRFHLPAGELKKLGEMGTPFGMTASYRNDFTENATQFAAFMKYGGSREKIRDYVERTILSPNALNAYRDKNSSWRPEDREKVSASVNRMVNEIIIQNNTGGSAHVTVNGMVAQ